MKHVLIVDDAATVRQYHRMILAGAGWQVAEASNGMEALEKVMKQSAAEPFDLYVVDVNMPRMDGITFVREVKKLPAYKFTPIIMLTTESEERKKQEGQAAGAKAWVVKPFQPPQMLAAVSKLILP